MNIRKILPALLVPLVALSMTACTSDASESDGTQQSNVSAIRNLMFGESFTYSDGSVARLSAPSGSSEQTVVLDFTNMSASEISTSDITLSVDGNGVPVSVKAVPSSDKVAPNGGTVSITFTFTTNPKKPIDARLSINDTKHATITWTNEVRA